LAGAVTLLLPDWGGTGSRGSRLPPWAQELTQTCPWYTFATMLVHDGRAVVATKSDAGPGPLLVVTATRKRCLLR
jgi:hypothetical protein